MSEVMTQGIIGMPFDLAMSNELSRHQFHGRAQSLLSDYAALEAECERLRQSLTKIHDRCEAFVGDDSGMQVHSLEVLMDIAARGLGSSL